VARSGSIKDHPYSAGEASHPGISPESLRSGASAAGHLSQMSSSLRSTLASLQYPWPSTQFLKSSARQLRYVRYCLDEWERDKPQYVLRLLGLEPYPGVRERWFSRPLCRVRVRSADDEPEN